MSVTGLLEAITDVGRDRQRGGYSRFVGTPAELELREWFGAEAARRGAEGLENGTPLLMLAGITAGSLALLPFAAGAVLRINLR